MNHDNHCHTNCACRKYVWTYNSRGIEPWRNKKNTFSYMLLIIQEVKLLRLTPRVENSCCDTLVTATFNFNYNRGVRKPRIFLTPINKSCAFHLDNTHTHKKARAPYISFTCSKTVYFFTLFALVTFRCDLLTLRSCAYIQQLALSIYSVNQNKNRLLFPTVSNCFQKKGLLNLFSGDLFSRVLFLRTFFPETLFLRTFFGYLFSGYFFWTLPGTFPRIKGIKDIYFA